MKKHFLYALVAASSLTACKKDDEPAPKTKQEILADKQWRYSAITASYTLNGKTETDDIYATLKPYDKDNFTTYKADKNFVDDEGPTRESASDPQTRKGTWDLNYEQTKLYLTYDGSSPEAVEVTQLTDATMVWRFVDDSQRVIVTYTITYTAF